MSSQLKIADSTFLDDIPERSICPSCESSRRFFCYDCCTLMPCLVGKIPHVKLPVKIHIVRHPKEKSGKSTGVQASVLAPDDVIVYLYPDFPDYTLDANRVALIYPKRDAKTLSSSENDADLLHFLKHVQHFVFIDCTWNQTSGMLKDPRLSSLRAFALTSYETQYWRPQRRKRQSVHSLATIEAIYYFCSEYKKYVLQQDENTNEYDNLLFFYEYFRKKVTENIERRKRAASSDDNEDAETIITKD